MFQLKYICHEKCGTVVSGLLITNKLLVLWWLFLWEEIQEETTPPPLCSPLIIIEGFQWRRQRGFTSVYLSGQLYDPENNSHWSLYQYAFGLLEMSGFCRGYLHLKLWHFDMKCTVDIPRDEKYLFQQQV